LTNILYNTFYKQLTLIDPGSNTPRLTKVLQPETVDFSSLLFFTKELRLSSSAVLMHGQAGQLPGVLANTGPHANLCILYTACFLIFKH
jgi:hypothetical protein